MKKQLIKLGNTNPKLRKHIAAVLDATEGRGKNASATPVFKSTISEHKEEFLENIQFNFEEIVNELKKRALQEGFESLHHYITFDRNFQSVEITLEFTYNGEEIQDEHDAYIPQKVTTLLDGQAYSAIDKLLGGNEWSFSKPDNISGGYNRKCIDAVATFKVF